MMNCLDEFYTIDGRKNEVSNLNNFHAFKEK